MAFLTAVPRRVSRVYRARFVLEPRLASLDRPFIIFTVPTLTPLPVLLIGLTVRSDLAAVLFLAGRVSCECSSSFIARIL